VNSEDRIVITEHGQPVATRIPFERTQAAIPFADRKLLSGFKELPVTDHDSSESISTDRNRA